jgi:hypothetical protein
MRLKVMVICAALVLIVCAAAGLFSQESRGRSTDATSEITGETGEEAVEEVTREDLLSTRGSVHGMKGRRLFRTAYWAAGLSGDMKRTYETHGYPSGRHREVKAGVTIEKWTYIAEGKQFVFRGDRLVRTERSIPGSATGIYLK